jgi:hypothetical protein
VLRCSAIKREREGELDREVAVAGDVEAVGGHGLEAEPRRRRAAIDRQRRACQRRGAEAQHVGALPAIGQTPAIAFELFGVGEPIMRGEHRLGSLQVRIAGRITSASCCATSDECAFAGRPVGRRSIVDRVADPNPQVGRNLVVAAAGRVSLRPTSPVRSVRARSMCIWMSSKLRLIFESTLLNPLADLLQGRLDLLAFDRLQ